MREYMQKHKWLLVITSVLIVLPIFGGLLLWDKLPEQVPFHWGINGEVDGWTSKPVAVFLMPAMMLAVQWLCVLATAMDPKAKDVTKTKMMGIVLWIIPLLNIVLHVMVYCAALGHEISASVVLPLIFGAMFVIMGNYLPKCKQSYTMGIKLPWTLNDEANWNATHRMAGKLWVAGGLLVMPCAPFPSAITFILMMAILLVMIVVPTVYSYLFFKKHHTEE